MILDRKTPPEVHLPSSFEYLKAETQELENGTLLHYINYGEQDILRLQLEFKAGSAYQSQSLIASTVNHLLVEGTSKKSAKEIAEIVENKGVFFDTECTPDTATLSIYCLGKQLESVLPILKEILEEACFPENEVEKYTANNEQKFLVNNQRVGFLARNHFLEYLYGEKNAYSNKVSEDDYRKVERPKLINFFKKYYLEGSLEIYAAGKVTADSRKLISEYFGSIPRGTNSDELNFDLENNASEGTLKIHKEDALQTAIRMGMPSLSKGHGDFPTLYVANTILGGYFGSRLMANIREDKGYTYGIGSGLISLRGIGYFVISTEVGAEFTEATLIEIQNELVSLSSHLISDSELKLVKNYLKGSIMRSFDGAFSAMDRFRSLRTLDLDYGYYDDLIKQINGIDSLRIKEVSEEYLQPSKLKTVLAGNFNSQGNH